MAAVYVSNIVINSGTDFSQIFTLDSSEDNSSLNLSGFEVSAQMRKYPGSSTSVIFSSNILHPETLGKIIIALTSEQTTVLKPGRYVYDIVISIGGVKTRVVEGMALVREGVTR